jgi:hypothetical protein
MMTESIADRTRNRGRTGVRPRPLAGSPRRVRSEYAAPTARVPWHEEWLALSYGIAVLILRAPLWLAGTARR